MLSPLIHTRPARSTAAVVALAVAIAVWFALGAIQAHWLVLAIFAIPPALLAWDLLKNDTAQFHLSDTDLRFGIGPDQTTLPLAQIEVVRLNRRLDFSWRVTLRLTDGQRARIPPPCLPPMAQLETALAARQIRTESVLFSFVG